MALEIFTENIPQFNADTSTTKKVADKHVDGVKHVSIHIKAASLDQSDGVLKVQDSNDGAGWVDVPSATITLNSGNSDNMIRIARHGQCFPHVE